MTFLLILSNFYIPKVCVLFEAAYDGYIKSKSKKDKMAELLKAFKEVAEGQLIIVKNLKIFQLGRKGVRHHVCLKLKYLMLRRGIFMDKDQIVQRETRTPIINLVNS